MSQQNWNKHPERLDPGKILNWDQEELLRRLDDAESTMRNLRLAATGTLPPGDILAGVPITRIASILKARIDNVLEAFRWSE